MLDSSRSEMGKHEVHSLLKTTSYHERSRARLTSCFTSQTAVADEVDASNVNWRRAPEEKSRARLVVRPLD